MRDPSHIIISAPGAPAPSTINVPQPIGNGAPTPTAGVVITMPNGERVTATAIIGEGQSGSQAATSIVVSGTMFSEGGPPITLPNGVVLSEAPSGTGIVVIDPSSGVTSTIAFSSVPGIYTPNTTPAPTAVITIGDRTYTAITRSGSVVIPELGLTLTDGGPAVTVNGTTVSDAGEGTGVVVGTSTAEFVTPSGSGGVNSALPTGAGGRIGEYQWWTHWWVQLAFVGSVIVVAS
ncbi:Nn.00g051010.m01.CDS01 [Neocucurbitaria sp. VM-36]